MSGPTWLSRAFAALMIAVALYHGGRLVIPRIRHAARYDVDLTHLAMGVAMALTLISPPSPRWSAGAALAFGVPAVWFTRRCMRVFVFDGAKAVAHHVPHVLACAAMIYMLAVSATGASTAATPGMNMAAGAMPAMSASSGSLEALAVPIAILLLATAGTSAAQLLRSTRSGQRNAALTKGCQLAMSTTMIYMLVMVL